MQQVNQHKIVCLAFLTFERRVANLVERSDVTSETVRGKFLFDFSLRALDVDSDFLSPGALFSRALRFGVCCAF